MIKLENRRQSILAIFEALTAGNLRTEGGDVLEEIFAQSAFHHRSSQPVREGPAGARHIYEELNARVPGLVATVKRSVCDGDFVAVHWHASTDPGDEFSGEAWCEFFRFDGDVVVEHWQLHVAVPSSTVSGRSVFSDAFERIQRGPRGAGEEAAINREVASVAFARFLDFDPAVVTDHWGEVYLQHNEIIPDGPEALRHSLDEIGALPEELRPHFAVLVTVAEGDLVWFLEQVRVGDQTGLGVDIFRLDQCLIVEHWDIPALRPGRTDGLP